MFKLQNMRNHRHLKWPVRIFFALVIISFIFFYGWSKSETGRHGETKNFAKLRSESANPLKRWQYLDNQALADAKGGGNPEQAFVAPDAMGADHKAAGKPGPDRDTPGDRRDRRG